MNLQMTDYLEFNICMLDSYINSNRFNSNMYQYTHFPDVWTHAVEIIEYIKVVINRGYYMPHERDFLNALSAFYSKFGATHVMDVHRRFRRISNMS